MTDASTFFRVGLANLSNTGRSFKQIVSMIADGSVSLFALWSAYTIRLDETYVRFDESWYIFLLLPIITVGLCASLGIYRWVVRTSTKLLQLQLFKASVLTSLVLLITLFLFPPHDANPRSIFLIYGMLFALISIGLRLTWQSFSPQDRELRTGEPIAIFGAGSAGRLLAKLMALSPDANPIFFIDDRASLAGSYVAGMKVIHGHNPSLGSLLKKYEVVRIVLAVPSLKGEPYREVLDRLSQFSLPVQTTPSLKEIVDGSASAHELRDISVDDVLGRTQVEADKFLIRKCVRNKSVLVTGGGGSIGSEICRQIIQVSPDKLVLIDQSEENLYRITEELRREIVSLQIECPLDTTVPQFIPVLGSVNDQVKINRLIKQHNISTVYHAAAYKHVPIVEQYPEEGIAVNVFGTKTVLDAAIKHGVETFVLISTDKAVRPSSAMGASKRVAEMVLQAKAREDHNTKICMVRFGNVLGSSGSVVPKFVQQIEQGGPITLTDEKIERYFMTIPEAAQLVLQASALANDGEVFVLDMGEPVKIMDLATKLVRLSGMKIKSEEAPDGDIEVQIVGLRPGEKMYEELFITDSARESGVNKILVEKVSFKTWSELDEALAGLEKKLIQGNQGELKDYIMKLAWDANLRAPKVELQRQLTV